MTPLESLARYLTETAGPVYALVRTAASLDPPVYAVLHPLGHVVTWSTSKRRVKDDRSAQRSPELYRVVKMQRVQ